MKKLWDQFIIWRARPLIRRIDPGVEQVDLSFQIFDLSEGVYDSELRSSLIDASKLAEFLDWEYPGGYYQRDHASVARVFFGV